MLKFKQILEKQSSKNIFLDYNNELWFGYSIGSGQTYRIDMRSYITDKKDDKNYNSTLINDFVRYSSSPIKSKSYQAMYALPHYSGKDQKNYDIYGGNESPDKVFYYIISKQKNVVINFFSSKKEAEMWIKSSF